MPHFGRALRLLPVLLLTVLAACDALPRSAPVEREIVRADAGNADFVVYTVDRDLIPALAHWPQVGPAPLPWLPTSGGARTQVIAAGDALDLTIWDSNENSLLAADGTRVVEIETLRVAPDGSIFVPYVGETGVAGLTLQAARRHLQDEIETMVPSAQVQVQMAEGRANSVDLVGGVADPGSYALPDRNHTVLNLIARGGGLADSLDNPQLRLIRHGARYGIAADRLFDRPDLDTRLIGGDRIIVEEDRRRFLALGASGQQTQLPFPDAQLTALEALSLVGGVNATRGDAGGILILREYPADAVRDAVPDQGSAPDPAGPARARVVFSVDLTSADGLFSARNFHIAPDDVVLVTESPVRGVQTIFGLIGSAFGVARQTISAAD